MLIFLKLLPLVINVIVGIISLAMAYKSLFSTRFLPFHEQAAGKNLSETDVGVQAVVIALMRVSGLGFLAIALLITVFPVAAYIRNDSFLRLVPSAIALVYCFGLFLINYRLFTKTGAQTPWKGALYCTIILGIGIVASCFS
jgi:hypothetical protein